MNFSYHGAQPRGLAPAMAETAQGGAVYLDASKHAQREGVRALGNEEAWVTDKEHLVIHHHGDHVMVIVLTATRGMQHPLSDGPWRSGLPSFHRSGGSLQSDGRGTQALV